MRFCVSIVVLVVCLAPAQAFQCSTSPYTTKNPQYTVCPNDNQTVKSFNDITNSSECNFVTQLPTRNCKSPEHTTIDSVCWRILEPVTGVIEVTFPLHPNCDYSSYLVTLMVHESLDCQSSSTSGEPFRKHSMKKVTLKKCTEASCKDQCSLRGSVVFRHVFSACYQLHLSPYKYFQSFQSLTTPSVFITTQYIKTSISSIDKPVSITLNNKTNGLTVRVQSELCPTSLCITLMGDINSVEDNCRTTGKNLASCETTLGNTEVKCTSYGGYAKDVTPLTCFYQGESVVNCEFSDLKPGNYCVRIMLEDERCDKNTVWNDITNYSNCAWYAFHHLTESEPKVDQIGPPLDSTSSRIIFTLVILIVIATCGLTGFVVYRRMLPHYPQFLPVRNNKPFQIPRRPNVLLLYARDCPAFLQAVEQLKLVMTRVYDCQVLDCWDDSQYDNVAQNPSRWLLSKLNDNRFRVVLVTSPASLLQEAALIHSKVLHYRQPKAFDRVFTHALMSLHEAAVHNSYKRLLVVRMDYGVEGVFPKMRTYLNPLTTYALPTHVNKLMATLHNMDSMVCTITPDGQMDVSILADAIAEYQQYLKDNPQYLDSLLVTEKGDSVLHILSSIQNHPEIC